MKKLFAVLVCISILMGLSCMAFAATNSPQPPAQKFQVELRKGKGIKVITGMDQFFNTNGESVIVEADDSFGTFNSWSLYKTDGSKAAGTDYELVGCDLNSKRLEFKAKVDLIVCANYNGETTNPLEASNKGQNTPTSYPTNDFTIGYVSICVVLGALTIFAAKKAFVR